MLSIKPIDQLLIYSAKSSNRLGYILNTLFKQVLGIDYILTNDWEAFKASGSPKLNYSGQQLTDCINITPHSILFDYGIKDYLIEVHSSETYFKYFFRNTHGDCPFDLLGASFWLISRYEEYLPFKSNKYNVFDYRSSLAWQNNFIDKPLVNVWLNELKGLLERKYSQMTFHKNELRCTTTIDIDNAFKYKHKGFVRTLAGFFNDVRTGRFDQFSNRMKTIFFSRQDEFDCYSFLVDCKKKYGTHAICFFLLGDYGVNDKNHPSSNLNFQTLIKHLADYTVAGIHPSFASNFNIQQLKVEIVRLSSIIHREIIHSRQHFGMLTFPVTYKTLMQSGIKHDYSLGYTNMNGFRASICFPYKWYNIADELETSLMLHPFCVNDVALDKESKSDETKAKHILTTVFNEVKSYGGEYIVVFHNDMLSNTPLGLNWRKVYEANQQLTTLR